jgi:hypothetical protein
MRFRRSPSSFPELGMALPDPLSGLLFVGVRFESAKPTKMNPPASAVIVLDTIQCPRCLGLGIAPNPTLGLPYVLILESSCCRKTYSSLPIKSRSFAFHILELIEPSPNQSVVLFTWDFKYHQQAGQEAQVLDLMVLQALSFRVLVLHERILPVKSSIEHGYSCLGEQILNWDFRPGLCPLVNQLGQQSTS